MNEGKTILSGLISALIICSYCYGEKYRYDVVEVEEIHKDTPPHGSTDKATKETGVSGTQIRKSDSAPAVLERFKNVISKISEERKTTTPPDKVRDSPLQRFKNAVSKASKGKKATAKAKQWKKNITDKKYIEKLEKNLAETEKKLLEKRELLEKEKLPITIELEKIKKEIKEGTSTESTAAKLKKELKLAEIEILEKKRIKELNPLEIKYSNYGIEIILAEIYKNLTVFISEKREAVVNELKAEREQMDATKKANTLKSLNESFPMLSMSVFGGIGLLNDSDLEFIKTIKSQENLPLSELFKKRREDLENSKRMKETEKLVDGQLSVLPTERSWGSPSTSLGEMRDVILFKEREIAEQEGRPTSTKFLPLHKLHDYKIDMINSELENALKESGRDNVLARINMLSMLENEALKTEAKEKKKAKTKRAAKKAPEESVK